MSCLHNPSASKTASGGVESTGGGGNRRWIFSQLQLRTNPWKQKISSNRRRHRYGSSKALHLQPPSPLTAATVHASLPPHASSTSQVDLTQFSCSAKAAPSTQVGPRGFQKAGLPVATFPLLALSPAAHACFVGVFFFHPELLMLR